MVEGCGGTKMMAPSGQRQNGRTISERKGARDYL